MADSATAVSAAEGNRQRLDGGAMFGNAHRALWSSWITPDERGRIELACRGMLVEHGGLRILCDTGIGAFFEPALADRYGVVEPRHVLRDSLEGLGLSHDDIDVVILSHLHFDHAGGLLNAFGEPKGLLFPKARYLVGKEAFERATKPHVRDKASFVPGLSQMLADSGRLTIVDGERVTGLADDRLSFRFTHGHTPGHMHAVFRGDLRTVVFAGDLIPGIPWVHLPITMGYDRFPELLIEEKRSFYEAAVAEKWLIFLTHDMRAKALTVAQGSDGRYRPCETFASLERLPL